MNEKLNLDALSLSFRNEKFDFKDLLSSLLAEKKIILIAILITCSIGFLHALTIVPQYESNALIQVENKQPGIEMGLGGVGALSGLNHQNSNTEVQITLIKSPFILKPVVESLGLDIQIQPHYFPFFGKIFARKRNKLSSSFLGLNKYAWGGENLEISRFNMLPKEQSKNIKLIAIAENCYEIYAGPTKILKAKVGELAKIKNKNLSMEIQVDALTANSGTEFFISKVSSEEIANTLSKRLQISDLGQIYQLDKTGILQLSIRDSSPLYVVNFLNAVARIALEKNIERKSVEASKTLKFLTEELPKIKHSIGEAEIALNEHNRQSGTIDLNIKSKMLLKQLADIQKEIEKANLSRIMLLQQFTPSHPYILGLQEKKIALRSELKSLEKEMQALPISDQISVALMRDIKVRSQLYLMLLNKIQELQVIKAGTLSDIRILNFAELPQRTLPTGRFLIIITSLLFGLALGSLIVILRKAFYRSIEDPNWLEQNYGLPTFAIIPYSASQSNVINMYKNHDKGLELLAKTKPRDLSIEALRSLRTSLQFALIGAKNNIISIMGVSPGIGKSFLSANFAYIVAESGKRTLLVDGDIRKGYLQDYFKFKRDPGLSEAISGEISLSHVIQKTDLSNLDFISSGKFPPNPSELLLSIQFKEILDALTIQYDLIIIDTPPILAVTDSSIIANYSGVNFLVMANGVHPAEELELTMKRLKASNVIVQGSIFNNVHLKKQKMSKYNYQYEYGESTHQN